MHENYALEQLAQRRGESGDAARSHMTEALRRVVGWLSGESSR
jgi:hypothetical protein